MTLQWCQQGLPGLVGATWQALELCMSSFFKYLLTWSYSIEGKYSLHQPRPLVSGTWDSWRLVILVKTEAKKTLSTSALSMSFVARSPALSRFFWNILTNCWHSPTPCMVYIIFKLHLINLIILCDTGNSLQSITKHMICICGNVNMRRMEVLVFFFFFKYFSLT